MTLFKRTKPQKQAVEPEQRPLFLKSEHAPCTCPEPCERDHGNE